MQGRLGEQDYIGFANLDKKAAMKNLVDDEAEELKQSLIQSSKNID